jgi:hypothetical protein
MSRVEIIGLKMRVVERACNIVKEILNAAKLQGIDVVDGDVGRLLANPTSKTVTESLVR